MTTFDKAVLTIRDVFTRQSLTKAQFEALRDRTNIKAADASHLFEDAKVGTWMGVKFVEETPEGKTMADGDRPVTDVDEALRAARCVADEAGEEMYQCTSVSEYQTIREGWRTEAWLVAFKAELDKRGLAVVKLPKAQGGKLPISDWVPAPPLPVGRGREEILIKHSHCCAVIHWDEDYQKWRYDEGGFAGPCISHYAYITPPTEAPAAAEMEDQVTDALADQMAAEEAAECTAEAELDAQVDGYVEPLRCDMCEAVIPEKDGGGFEPHVCGMPCVDCGKDASALGWSWITDTDVICHPCRDSREAKKNPKAGAAIARARAYDR